MTISDLQFLESINTTNSETNETNETNECSYNDVDEEKKKYEVYSKHSYEIIENLPSIMIKMKLKNSFIIGVISDLTKKFIINEKDYQKLMLEVLNEIEFFKKLSINSKII